MSVDSDHSLRKAWYFVTPAIAWTIAFFVIPFAFMVSVSLASRVGRQIVYSWDLGNYINFFSKSYLLIGLFVSLEITFLVTILSTLLA